MQSGDQGAKRRINPARGVGEEMNFPNHQYGLHLSHNEHKTVGDSVEEWLQENSYFQYKDADEDQKRMIETDTIWCLRWYPRTRNTSLSTVSSTLEGCLQQALKWDAENE